MSLLILLLLLDAGSQAQTDNNWPQTEARLNNLLSGDSEQKRTALAEIRNLRTEQASRLAIPSLTDKNETVRATAASSVVFLPESEAAKALLPLLDDKEPFVRREAAYALGQVGSAAATNKLSQVLSRDRDPEVRSAAAISLGNIGDSSAIEGLIRALARRPAENEEFLRRSAARAIGQVFEFYATGRRSTLTPQNFLPPKFKELDSGRNVAQLAQGVDPNAVAAVLSKVLQNPREADDTRREAAFALGAMRRPASAAVLRSYINSPDPYLAEIIKEALLKIENRNR